MPNGCNKHHETFGMPILLINTCCSLNNKFAFIICRVEIYTLSNKD